MSKIIGILIIFAAAWLMVYLQAGGAGDRSDPEHGRNRCEDLSRSDGCVEGRKVPESDTRDKEKSD